MQYLFKQEEIQLFEIIAESLSGIDDKNTKKINNNEEEVARMLDLARNHAILPMLYPSLHTQLKDQSLEFLEAATREVAMEFYQILFGAHKIVSILESSGIPVVLLKGASVARFYPVPEYRRSADIDILLVNPDQTEEAAKALSSAGYRPHKEIFVNHSQDWATPDNHILELHTLAVEPFPEEWINDYINSIYRFSPEQIHRVFVLGFELPVLSDSLLAFHLLLHMLMDFLRSGFGLKLLCDWVVFWNAEHDSKEIDLFLKHVQACGLTKYLHVITGTCITYLGLKKERVPFYQPCEEEICKQFLRDVVDAESGGRIDTARMVTLREAGYLGYLKQFHYHTVLQYPRARHIWPLLPILYVIAFTRFMINNRTVRQGESLKNIFKSAANRGALVQKLDLFTKTEASDNTE